MRTGSSIPRKVNTLDTLLIDNLALALNRIFFIFKILDQKSNYF